MSNTPIERSLRINSVKIRDVIRRLEESARDVPESKREDVRVRYAGRDIVVGYQVTPEQRSFSVTRARNLSTTGIAVLHRGYIHAQTPCEVVMTTLWGDQESATGVVARCGYVEGQVHEVGIRFDHPIDPRRYVAEGEEAFRLDEEIEDVPPLTGRVLFLDDAEPEFELFKHHVRGLEIELVNHATSAEALAKLAAERFEVFFCDLNLGQEKGEKVIREARAQGYRGPIVALTGERSPLRLRAARDSGANRILLKPYHRGSLLLCMAELLRKSSEARATSDVASQLGDDSDTMRLVEKYIAEVQGAVDTLRASLQSEDADGLRSLAVTLRDTAKGYGFPSLSEAAGAVVASLEATKSLADSQTQIEQLIDIAQRLKSS